jgi:hypothetical protein
LFPASARHNVKLRAEARRQRDFVYKHMTQLEIFCRVRLAGEALISPARGGLHQK